MRPTDVPVTLEYLPHHLITYSIIKAAAGGVGKTIFRVFRPGEGVQSQNFAVYVITSAAF